MAGGLGTRLQPLTHKIPKALVKVANRPFVFWQLDLIASSGIEEVVLCVGYLGEQVEKAVGKLYRGLSIKYAYEQPGELLGTGGALKNAQQLLQHSFGVLYGDSYLEIEYNSVFEAHNRSDLPVTMAVWKNQNKYDSSNVVLSEDERHVVRYEKGRASNGLQYIDYGFSVFDKNLIEFRFRAGEPVALTSLQHELSKEKLIGAFVIHKRFYEIGSWAGLAELERYLLNHMV